MSPHPLLLCALALIAGRLPAQEDPVAFVGARIIPIEGDEIEDGVLVVHKGEITAIGPRGSVALPDSGQFLDASGKVILPGLVDTHSHIGGPGGGDRSAPLQPDVRVFDSLNALDSGFRRAVAGGLTTLNVMSGSGHLLSGQTVYLKPRRGTTIEDLAVRDAEGMPLWGIKMANGTNSRRDPPFPGTRGKSAALVRERFVAAQEYSAKLAKAAGGDGDPPDRDLGLEALAAVLDGTRIVHHHTHRADDIVTVLRLQREFGFRVVLHHVSEAHKVAAEIAAADAPCSVIVIDTPGGKLEAAELVMETGAVLEQAGAKVAFHTDDGITDSRLFLRSAALAVRAGMSREGALRALTLAGAEMLDLQDRVGSLVVGKDADLVVLDGDPLSVYTKVVETWIEGEKVFDRADPEDRLQAVGGYGARRDSTPYLCCFDDHEEAAR